MRKVVLIPNFNLTWSAYYATSGELLDTFETRDEAVEFIKSTTLLFTHEYDADDYRVCSWTGKVFNDGFCIEDGARYTDDADLAAKYLREQFGYGDDLSTADVIELAYNDEVCYYTEWY